MGLWTSERTRGADGPSVASLTVLATLAMAAAFAVFSGCAGSPPALSVLRSHSAGVELVTSMGPDVEAPFHLEREWRLGGLAGELHVTDCTVPPGEVVRGWGYTDVIPAIRRLAMDPEGRAWILRGAVADEANRVDSWTPPVPTWEPSPETCPSP